MDKKLMLSNTDKKMMGVCGGIGEYLGVDPTVVRVLWVIGTVVTGIFPLIVVYGVLSFVIPNRY